MPSGPASARRRPNSSPRRAFATPRETRERWSFPAMGPHELREATARPAPRLEWVAGIEKTAEAAIVAKATPEAIEAATKPPSASKLSRRDSLQQSAEDSPAGPRTPLRPVPPLRFPGPASSRPASGRSVTARLPSRPPSAATSSTSRPPSSSRPRQHPKLPRPDMVWSPSAGRRRRPPSDVAALFTAGDADPDVFRPTVDADSMNAKTIIEDVEGLDAAVNDHFALNVRSNVTSRRESLQGGAASGMFRTRRRASSVSGGADTAGARGTTVSPTRRNGRIAFVEGGTAYLVDFEAELILPFDPSDVPKGVVAAPGTNVSFRRSLDVGRGLASATAIGVPQRRLSSHASHQSMRTSSDGLSGSGEVTPSDAVRHPILLSGRSPTQPTPSPRSPATRSPAGRGASPPATMSPEAVSLARSVGGASGEEETFGVPAKGWEFYRLLQRIKGDDRVVTASPDTLVRMVDASCRFDEEEAAERREALRRAAQEREQRVTELDRLPSDGPLVEDAAKRWSRGKHPATVIHAVHRALHAPAKAREDGEHLVFDELPTRLAPDVIEEWNEDPMDARREKMQDRASTAKHAYGQWYLPPAQLAGAYQAEKAMRDNAQAQRAKAQRERRKRAGAEASERLRQKSPPLKATPGGVSVVTTSSAAGTIVVAREKQRETQLAEEASRGVTGGERQLAQHIERIQSGDADATETMVQIGLKVRREEAKAAALRKRNPELAFKHQQLQQQQQQVADGEGTGSPKAPDISLTRPASPSAAAANVTTMLSSAAKPSTAGGRYRLPKTAYHGRLWALSQGDALTTRNAPDEADAAKANAAFMQLMHKHRHPNTSAVSSPVVPAPQEAS